LIPDQLLSASKQGDRVLFLGADLPLGYQGAPLSRPELAQALAERYGLQAGQSWPETATAYLGRFANNLQGLTAFVLEQCGDPQTRPGPIHNAIARIGFRAVVTAWYDDLLERALRDAGYRVNCVVRNEQVPYADEGEREVIVVKLYGCLSDPASLVLDRFGHEDLMDRLDRKLELVTSFFSLRPSLFVGFDLLDLAPIRLYLRSSRNMAKHMKRAYAIWPHDLEAVQGVWRDKNVEFCRADATAFLKALADQQPAVSAIGRDAIRVHRPPYKFLRYYDADDADIFCGRDTERQIVIRLVLSNRLLTLFGPSGAGKTSLLLAGVVPRLAAQGYGHVYVRALDDPLAAMRRAIATRAGQADSQVGNDLRAFLAATLKPQDRLVVILDQFEELFIRVGSGKRFAFFEQLARALTDAEREVRVIISLREDHLARLHEARPYLPDILSNSWRLSALDQANAWVAITEPAARAGVEVEATLVDALVGGEGRDATGETGALIEADDQVIRVSPAALQIVLDRLYRHALPAGHRAEDPPPPGVRLTLAAYRSFQHTQQRPGEEPRLLTGAEAILASYVPEGLAGLPALLREDERTPLGADPELGREILKVMVTGQATKAALTEAEIQAALEEAGLVQIGDEADKERLKNTRLGLQRVRLVHGFERDGMAYYELTHDCLAREIATWIDQEEMQTRLAREILRRALDNWQHAKLLIPSDALQLIHVCCEDLHRLKPDELQLLFRSTLATGYEVGYWFKRAREGGVDVDDIALEGVRSDCFRTRAAAVVTLGQLGELFAEPIVGLLTDDYPQVRAAAIRVLEQLRPTGEWRQQLKYECYVPAGEFVMGEEPEARLIGLDAYYIGRYPVTMAEYKCYMDDQQRAFDLPEGKADHPVVRLSWRDAQLYADWAGRQLLSEAQWEKAASWDEETGTKRRYPWGDEFDENRCNTVESRIEDTTPVGAYSPQGDSPYGCADMSGNVWEWTINDRARAADFVRYDPAAIPALLKDAFTLDNLQRFCSDRPEFRPFLSRIGPGQSLEEIADGLLTYCLDHLLCAELLVRVREFNPRQYYKHSRALHGDFESTGSDSLQQESQAVGEESREIDTVSRVDHEDSGYNLGAIRELLLVGFAEGEVRRFCQDYPIFRLVVTRFPMNRSLQDTVDVLIEYCYTYGLFADLLGVVQELNPRQYERFADRLYDRQPPPAAQPGVEPGGSMLYNTDAIRSLVRTGFSAADLQRLCMDSSLLRPVLPEFGPASSLEEMIDVLIHYCQAQKLFPHLLSQIQGLRPRLFLRYVGIPPSDIVAIRNLIEDVFQQESYKLVRFCRDSPALAPIDSHLSPSMGLRDMIDAMIDYCWMRLLFYELLSELEEKYPEAYDKHYGQFYGGPAGRKDDTAADLQVLRGGSFRYGQRYARSTYRLLANPDLYRDYRGVRMGFSIATVFDSDKGSAQPEG
jgi:formylglycine-generating enzyme required for sulfatase activity